MLNQINFFNYVSNNPEPNLDNRDLFLKYVREQIIPSLNSAQKSNNKEECENLLQEIGCLWDGGGWHFNSAQADDLKFFHGKTNINSDEQDGYVEFKDGFYVWHGRECEIEAITLYVSKDKMEIGEEGKEVINGDYWNEIFGDIDERIGRHGKDVIESLLGMTDFQSLKTLTPLAVDLISRLCLYKPIPQDEIYIHDFSSDLMNGQTSFNPSVTDKIQFFIGTHNISGSCLHHVIDPKTYLQFFKEWVGDKHKIDLYVGSIEEGGRGEFEYSDILLCVQQDVNLNPDMPSVFVMYSNPSIGYSYFRRGPEYDTPAPPNFYTLEEAMRHESKNRLLTVIDHALRRNAVVFNPDYHSDAGLNNLYQFYAPLLAKFAGSFPVPRP